MLRRTVDVTFREIPAKINFSWSLAGGRRLGGHPGNVATFAVLRALPAQLDLFTAVVGGGGVGGIVGGAVAWILGEDLAQGGILGGVLGMVFGALLAVMQSAGLYS
jgi:hypothetical protein